MIGFNLQRKFSNCLIGASTEFDCNSSVVHRTISRAAALSLMLLFKKIMIWHFSSKQCCSCGSSDPCDPCGPGLRGQVGQGDSENIWFSWSTVVCSGVYRNHNLPKSCRNCNLQFKRCLEPQYAKKWFEGQFVKSRKK